MNAPTTSSRGAPPIEQAGRPARTTGRCRRPASRRCRPHLAVGVLDRASGSSRRRRAARAAASVGHVPDLRRGVRHGAADGRVRPARWWCRRSASCARAVERRSGVGPGGHGAAPSRSLTVRRGRKWRRTTRGGGPGRPLGPWVTPRHWRVQVGRYDVVAVNVGSPPVHTSTPSPCRPTLQMHDGLCRTGTSAPGPPVARGADLDQHGGAGVAGSDRPTRLSCCSGVASRTGASVPDGAVPRAGTRTPTGKPVGVRWKWVPG